MYLNKFSTLQQAGLFICPGIKVVQNINNGTNANTEFPVFSHCEISLKF